MSEFTKYPPNTFCWPELITTDVDGAKAFYGGLFGWDTSTNEVAPGMHYTMATLRDKAVGAMYARNDQMKEMGVPPHWLQYVSVANLDDTLSRARELGANVTVDAMDVFDIGRMAVLADPAGAMFALWQPKQHIGAELANEPGSFTWNELMTNDLDKAGSFYTNLFGWTAQHAEMSTGPYTSFMNGDRPAAGMMTIPKEAGGAPPNWMVYFAVADCDASAKQVTELGGKVVHGPFDIEEVGRTAIIQDPQGVVSGIIQLKNPQ